MIILYRNVCVLYGSVYVLYMQFIYRGQKNSMLKLGEVKGGPKQRFIVSICWTCILAVPWTIKVGLTEVGFKAKPLNYSEKEVYCTNLEQMCKGVATDVDTQPRVMQ